MKFRNRRTLRAARAAAELFDDDGVDPRTAFSRESGRSASEADRKSMQAARVAQRAIEAATMGGARLLRREDQLGSIEAGKLADVVGFAADPLVDIHNIRDVRFVMKDGAVARNDL